MERETENFDVSMGVRVRTEVRSQVRSEIRSNADQSRTQEQIGTNQSGTRPIINGLGIIQYTNTVKTK